MDHKFLLPEGGGFRKLRSFILARLCYDITVLFCERFIPRESRTRDQMIQAARSGVQNIAEGSVASATSKETEIKLTNVAKASLKELTLDYEDFLRQHQIDPWGKDAPLYQDFVRRKISDKLGFRTFIKEAASSNPDVPQAVLVANATLLLLRVVDYLLGRQLLRLSSDFIENGGLREHMTDVRCQWRKKRGWDKGRKK